MQQQNDKTSRTQEVALHVTGMSCTGCENRIKSVLEKAEGVRRSTANHETGQVHVLLDPKRITHEAVAERIEAMGYGVKE